jgi:succinyl-diaminopimelate desuccinylase
MAGTESLDAVEARLVAAVDARADELVELLCALVRAPSINPPGDTRAAVGVAAAYLERAGAAPRVQGESDERPSVVAEVGRGEPRLLFLSHLDTVPLGSADAWSVDPLGGAVRDGRVWGRGAADAKGSAAAMLVAIRVLGEVVPGLRGRATVALVADEETGGAGARYLLDRGQLAADAVVVGETTDNQVAVAEKGVAWLRLSTRGRTVHASVPDAGVNAAVHLVRWLARLERELVPRVRARRHALVSPPSLSNYLKTVSCQWRRYQSRAQASLSNAR